jgi:hypothetical protein
MNGCRPGPSKRAADSLSIVSHKNRFFLVCAARLLRRPTATAHPGKSILPANGRP